MSNLIEILLAEALSKIFAFYTRHLPSPSHIELKIIVLGIIILKTMKLRIKCNLITFFSKFQTKLKEKCACKAGR